MPVRVRAGEAFTVLRSASATSWACTQCVLTDSTEAHMGVGPGLGTTGLRSARGAWEGGSGAVQANPVAMTEHDTAHIRPRSRPPPRFTLPSVGSCLGVREGGSGMGPTRPSARIRSRYNERSLDGSSNPAPQCAKHAGVHFRVTLGRPRGGQSSDRHSGFAPVQ